MKHLFIALFIAFPSFIFAQSNYKEGYVLKNNGDTLKGYIDYKDWALSPLSIEFKTNKTDNTSQQFDPKTIKGFQINDFEIYTSYIGVISTNRNIFPDLPVGLDTSNKRGAIFLKQLVTGSHITLFYNNETKKNRFFIAETHEQPVELKYYDYYQNSGGQEVYDNLYRGQLLLYLYKFNSGDQKLKDKLEYVKFEQSDLEDIVNAINNNGVDRINNKSGIKRASKTRFYVGGGINYTSTQFEYVSYISGVINDNGATYTQHYLNAYSNSIAPKINLGIDIFTNPNVQKFLFRVELSYSYVNGQFNRSVSDNYNSTTLYNLSFTQHNVVLAPQFLYNVYNTDKLKFYLDAGAALSLSFYAHAQIENQTLETISPLDLKGVWAYYPFQLGVVFNKKTEISITYTTASNYSNYSDIFIKNQSLCLGFKYLFGNK